MSDPLHEVLLVASHPEHVSHGQTYQATVGATLFGGLLIFGFGLLAAIDPKGLPLAGAAVLGTAFTGGFAWTERGRAERTLPKTWTLTPHQLLTDEGTVPLEAITGVEMLERAPWLRVTTEQRTWELPQGYRVALLELRAFHQALTARREELAQGEERPEAQRALQALTEQR